MYSSIGWQQEGVKSAARRAAIVVCLASGLLGAVSLRSDKIVPVSFAANQCQFVVRPVTRSFGAIGGSGSLTILTAEGCPWNATSNANWIQIVNLSPGGVLGPGRLDYIVLPSSDVSQRSGSMTVAGQSVTLTQAGAIASSCNVTAIATGGSVNGSLTPSDCLSPIRIKNGAHPLADRFSFTGTAGQAVVITASSFDFDTYLYLLDGNGSIVAQNDDSGIDSRIPQSKGSLVLPAAGTYTIEVTSFNAGVSGNYSLSLTAPGGSCTYSLSQSGLAFGIPGGNGNLNVVTQPGCLWTITSNNAWISATAPGGSGAGSASISVLANGGVARTGSVTIAGLQLTVVQAGTNGSGCPSGGSLNPATASPGNVITISGPHFNGVSSVRFAGNAPAQFSVNGDTQITTTVPAAAANGPITISKPACADVMTSSFTVNGVVASVSAASFALASVAGEGIVAAFGANLATGLEVAGTIPLPTSLLGTTVKVRDVLGVERLAPLFFVSGAQINYQVPPGTALGPASVTVQSGNGTISTGTLEVLRVSPGIFTAASNGAGIAAAQALRVRNGTLSYEPIAAFSSGQFVPIPIDLGPPTDQVFLVLFGTGIRNRLDLATVTASIGASPASVIFAGVAPGYIGLDQLNIPLSRDLIGKGQLTVAVVVEGRPANVVTINVK